jgi:hypothetical protein
MSRLRNTVPVYANPRETALILENYLGSGCWKSAIAHCEFVISEARRLAEIQRIAEEQTEIQFPPPRPAFVQPEFFTLKTA